jgi:hypothetical protein
MFFLQDLVNMATPRNGGATKAGRLSVFLPFRQGDDDRTLWPESLCGDVLDAGAFPRHGQP